MCSHSNLWRMTDPETETVEPLVPTWFDDWFKDLFPNDQPVLKPSEVIQTLKIPKDRLYRAINYGALDAFRTGKRRWHIPRPGLKNWLIECYTLNI